MVPKEWLKSAAVALLGGACAALSAAVMDPTKFNLANGIKDELLIALQGAAVGLGALFIRSPLGSSLMKALADARQQQADDRAAISKLKAEIKSQPGQAAAPAPDPAGGPPGGPPK
jgi:hypothetical protein